MFSLGNGADELSKRHWFRLSALLEQAEEDLANMLRLSTIEPECELIQVGLKMNMLDTAMMGSEQPTLEQRDDPVHARQQPARPGVILPDHSDTMTVSLAPEVRIAPPAIGNHLAARLNGFLDEGDQRLCGEVCDVSEACTTDLLARSLNRHGKSGLFYTLSPEPTRIDAAKKRIINLDHPYQPFSPGTHCGAAQLVEPCPGGLIALESKEPLQPLGAPSGLLGAYPPDGKKPYPKGLAGSRHNGAGGQGGLSTALCALNVVPEIRPPLGMATRWATKSLWPADSDKVSPTGFLASEPLLELDEVCREVLLGHATILPLVAT